VKLLEEEEQCILAGVEHKEIGYRLEFDKVVEELDSQVGELDSQVGKLDSQVEDSFDKLFERPQHSRRLECRILHE